MQRGHHLDRGGGRAAYTPECAVSSTTRLVIDPRPAEAETSPVTTIMTTGVYSISVALLTAAWLSCPVPALAQSYTIQKPGELPTYIRKTGSGKDAMTAADVVKYLTAVTDGADREKAK